MIMAKNYETGHAKNVANFSRLIKFCEGYGAGYDPAYPAITIKSLNALLDDAQKAVAGVASTKYAESNAINDRRQAYKGIKAYSSRLISSLKSSSAATKQTIEDAKGFHRKVKGIRAADLNNNAPVDGTDGTPNHISVSQLSYSNLVEHLTGISNIISGEATYATNVADMQPVGITAFINNLREQNDEVNRQTVAASNSRIARNSTLYAESDGVFFIAQKVKDYIKSVYKQNSPQYKQVSNIAFTSPR